MLFNSWQYAALLAVTVAVYWALPWQRARQVALLVASVIFYASWQPIFLLLMAFVIASVFALTLLGRRDGYGWAAIVAVLVPLGILTFFKYTNFALGAASDFGRLFGSSGWTTHFNIILPLGISFYTFQVISYVVDVRRGAFPPERDPLVFSLFVTYFPHLIAGPICRADQLIPQLTERRSFAWGDVIHGLLLFASGLFLKVALADSLSPYVNRAFDAPEAATAWGAMIAIVGFGVVILCDFWGYSTMALGSAYMMGIKLPLNFNLPYLATSLQTFWRRWHITLSNWLRDYLYIPLGGSRVSRFKIYRNLLITFVLGGLWHGAAYTFLIWGFIHGAWLGVERVFRPALAKLDRFRWLNPLRALLGWVITMAVVFFAWVFFRADNVQSALAILQRTTVASGAPLGDLKVALFFMALFALTFVPLNNFQARPGWIAAHPAVKLVAAFWLLVGAALLGSGTVEQFIYFQF